MRPKLTLTGGNGDFLVHNYDIVFALFAGIEIEIASGQVQGPSFDDGRGDLPPGLRIDPRQGWTGDPHGLGRLGLLQSLVVQQADRLVFVQAERDRFTLSGIRPAGLEGIRRRICQNMPVVFAASHPCLIYLQTNIVILNIRSKIKPYTCLSNPR